MGFAPADATARHRAVLRQRSAWPPTAGGDRRGVRGNLAKSLPAVIAAIRRVVGKQRFTVIFDRGGYDGQLFKWLVEQGLDFITYQRGEVHLDDHLFARREVRWDGQRVRFYIAEDAVTVGDSGPWRRIVIRTPGHQRPILTSLDAAG